jgi:hypothetical protein
MCQTKSHLPAQVPNSIKIRTAELKLLHAGNTTHRYDATNKHVSLFVFEARLPKQYGCLQCDNDRSESK